MRHLIIHSGSPKTGTSYIQKELVRNSNSLIDKGILYPGIRQRKYIREANVNINGQLLTHIFTKNLNFTIDDVYSDVVALIESLKFFPEETCLISDETLCVINPIIWKLFREICTDLDIQLSVIAYFRLPENYYPSHWAQIVRKHSEIRSLREFIEQDRLPIWHNILKMNAEIVNFTLLNYDVEKNASGILPPFYLHGCNIDEPFKEEYDSKVNESLSLNALTALRFITQEFGGEVTVLVNDVVTGQKEINVFSRPILPQDLIDDLKLRHDKEYMECLNISKPSTLVINQDI